MKTFSIALLGMALMSCTQGLPTQPSPQDDPRPTDAGFAGEATVEPFSRGAARLNFRAHLSGDQEVPARDTRAQGEAVFQLSADGSELSYRLMVANIENVVASHIHVGPADANGPIVAFLFGPQEPGGGRTDGVLARGAVTADDLVGVLTGATLADLVAHIEAGNTYVNVHTNDGVGDVNTGPGDLASGEIRGQIG